MNVGSGGCTGRLIDASVMIVVESVFLKFAKNLCPLNLNNK